MKRDSVGIPYVVDELMASQEHPLINPSKLSPVVRAVANSTEGELQGRMVPLILLL